MNSKPLQKVTILGGSGFIGTNLAFLLDSKKVPFEIVDIKTSASFAQFYKFGDVRDATSLENSITGDVVVNLAAVHRDDVRDKREYYKTNVQGMQKLTDFCERRGISKIVFTSSVAVYGFAESGTSESGKIDPFNDYGKSKFQAEEVLREWRKSSPLNEAVVVRPTVVFGEGNRGNVFNLLSQIASGRFVMIGSGKNKKSMAYVKNIAAYLEYCIERKADFDVINYVDSPDLNMEQLVSQVRSKLHGLEGVGIRIPFWLGLAIGHFADALSFISGKVLPVSSVRVRKFCAETSFETAIDESDGFRRPFSLEDGLERTLESEFVNPDPKRLLFFTE